MSDSKIQIGTIVGIIGIGGQLKVKTFLINPKKIDKFGPVIINSMPKKTELNFKHFKVSKK